MFFGIFGGGDSDAYNDESSWADDDPDEGDLGQAFVALEMVGIDSDEACDYIDELILSGVSVGELDAVIEGVMDHVDDEGPDELEPLDDAPGVFDVENGVWFR